ncbi:MAG: HlyD family secretion protein [Roseococcus sp.]
MTEPEATQDAPPARRSRSGLWVGMGLVALLLLALGVNIAFDRFTPYTSEATLQAPVIGVVANVSGDITAVEVVDNRRVSAGDLLFEIDPQRYAAAVAQAEANLADAGQRVGASTAAIGATEARLLDARASFSNARDQTARTMELVRRGVYPQARADEAAARLASAQAAVTAGEAGVEEARRRLGPAGEDNPAIRLARAQLARALIDLAATRVKAPQDGMVTNTVLTVGQYAASGRSLVTIVDVASAWVIANLPENALGRLRQGDAVEIVLDALPGRVLRGRVDSVASGVNQTIAASLQGELPRVEDRRRWLRGPQRMPVRIHIDEDLTQLPIRAGARAGLVIYTSEARVMAVVAAAWIRFVSVMRFSF